MLVAALEVEALRAFAVLEGRIAGLNSGSDSQTANQLCRSRTRRRECRSLCGRPCRRNARRCIFAGSRLRFGGVPGFDAFALEDFDDLAVERRVEDRLVAAFAQEDGDGHAPDALAADAPVGARGDHVGDALLAPGRVPDHLVDLLDGELAEGGFRAVGALDRSFKPMNHCSVARKMTGLWQRQQCG
jgi:hypothetical protein